MDNWNKETIDNLLHFFENKNNKDLFDSKLKELDNYIKWYQQKPMYSIDDLKELYCIIHNDIYFDDIHDDYVKTIHHLDNANIHIYDYFFAIIIGIIFIICFLYYLTNFEKQKHVYENELPIQMIIDNISRIFA